PESFYGLFQNKSFAIPWQTSILRQVLEIGQCEVGHFAVNAELMKAGEVAALCVAEIVCRRQVPHSLSIHHEGEVLDMIVLIAANDVENHATKLLLHAFLCQAKLAHSHEQLLVGVMTAFAIIKMSQRSEALHELLSTLFIAIKATR